MNQNNPQPQIPDLDQELLNKKVQEMETRFAELQAELGLIQVPTVNWTMFGAMPSNVWMTKEEFDRRMKAGMGVPDNGLKQ